MTGIERLRELARRKDPLMVPSVHGTYCAGYVAATEDMSEQLSAITDQIEREQDASVADSPYDAILPEDSEAIAWVREHGGLSHVKEHWSGRVALSHVHNMAERHKAKIARMQNHIEFVQGKCRERQERIVELNKTIADMRPRLMPEVGWPRYEDGEMVLIGSDFADWLGETHTVTSIEFLEDETLLHWNPDEPEECVRIFSGERVRRPAKVPGADGAEIREGDEVWSTTGEFDGKRTVSSVYIDPGEPPYAMFDERRKPYSCLCCCLTHRAPVLAADGKPLREGETVWLSERGFKSKLVDRGEPLKVVAFDKNGSVGVLDRDGIALGETSPWWFNPSCLTHERPVLDADGVEIRVGDTVYLLPGDWCDKFPLLRCHEWDAMKVLNLRPNHDTGRIECRTSPDSEVCYPYPSQLTHERPDSWERLEKDANAAVCVYFGASVKDCENCDHNSWECSYDKARDLVRRCRALAERERGE